MMKLYTSLFALATLVSLPASAFDNYTMANYTISPEGYSHLAEIETVTIHWSGLEDGIDANIITSNIGNYARFTCGDKEYKAQQMYAGTGLETSIDDLVLVFDKITEPGTYVFTMDAEVIKDYYQSEMRDEGEGYSVNGPITVTYYIDGAASSDPMHVYNLDPADGSTLTAITSIAIEFPEMASYEGIDEYSEPTTHITLTCGDKTYYPVSVEYNSPEYTIATATFEPITEPGTYTFTVAAGTFKDFAADPAEEKDLNPEIKATYTIGGSSTIRPGYILDVYSITPEDGATLSAISIITIIFPESVENNRGGIDEYGRPEENVTLTCGDKVYKPTEAGFNDDYSGAVLTFETITEPGTYELLIPAEEYRLFSDYSPDEKELSPEIKATYIISDKSGIENITGADNGKVTVVDMLGRTVLRNADNSSLNTLSPGIYIVNGKKTAVRK